MPDGSIPAVDEGRIGDELDLLFSQLARAGFRIGPREQANVGALVADLLTRGEIGSFKELKPWLAPLLARSTPDRERFSQVFDLLEPKPYIPTSGKRRRRRELPRGLWTTLWTVTAITIAAVTWWNWPERTIDRLPPVAATTSQQGPQTPVTAPLGVSTATAFSILNRIALAAEPYEDAPTLDELALRLARDSSSGWPATGLAARISELSGLPRFVPLAIYGADGRDGHIWAMIGLALDRIERPGREARFAELLTAANETLKSGASGRPVYQLATALGGYFAGDVPSEKSALISEIQKHHYTKTTGSTEAPPSTRALDELTIQRALAIAPEPRVRHVFADSPWTPPRASKSTPWWVAWLVALLPLTLAAIWFSHSLTLRKAYLRRRPPELPPLHLDIVSEAANRVRYANAIFQKAAQKLRQRTSRPTARLDLERSIAATIGGGGEIFAPVYESARHMPEYLVLIDRSSIADQDALRLRNLVRRIEGMVVVTVFYYRTEPSRLEPEPGGQSISIEQAQASFPDHRLLILGSGADFLEPSTLIPHHGAEMLTYWSQRALLSPLPLAEWGREELALAEQLQLPIGRATPNGLLALAELLGLEGNAPENLVDPRGDGVARPLPPSLRSRMQRLLYNAPPSGTTVDQIVQDLRNYLDGPGFEWLCGLAIYPSVQWDLTLYVGVMLPERLGGNASNEPLYREDRIAALTQLPWLRQGVMPNWLRTALINQLPAERAVEIRELLRRLIDAANLSGDVRRDDAVKLRISHESSKDRLPPQELLDDEVLLDFLARGRIEDFALPRSRLLERLIPRGFLDRIGIPELAAGLVAAAYALTAFLVAPRPGDGALPTGAWLPLIALGGGALLALVIASPAAALQAARSALIRAAPSFLAYAALTFVALMIGAGKIALMATNPIVALILAALSSVFLLRIGRRIARLFRLPVLNSGRPPLHRFLIDLGWGLLLLMLAYATCALGQAQSLRPADASGSALLITPLHEYAVLSALAAFVCAWVVAHFVPERLPAPKPLPTGSGPWWGGGIVRVAMALVPLLPAAWLAAYIQSSSVRLPSVSGVTTMAALSSGSLVAVGSADGTAHVIDVKGRLDRPVPVGAAPIADLALRAVRDDDANAPVHLAAAATDGRIRLYDARAGTELPMPPYFPSTAGAPSKVHVALGNGASLVAAIETDTGEIKLVADGGSATLTDVGPVTALAATVGDLFAFATLDGKVRLLKAPAGSTPQVLSGGGEVQVPGQVRRLTYNPAAAQLTVLGDEGTSITVDVAESQLRNAKVSAPLTALMLGPPIKWQADTRPVGREPGQPQPRPSTPAVATSEADIQSDDWYVLPVYYATDRGIQPNATRVSFGSERGRKLTLGRTMVSVPKTHQVVNVERPWSIRVPFFDVTVYEEAEDPRKHFTLQSIEQTSREDFVAKTRARIGRSQEYQGNALVFIHGYNTAFDNAVYRTAQIAYALRFDGPAFLYSWPSGGAIASYTYDRESAQASEPYLREFLDLVSKETGARTISIIAHNMGCQPLLQVLRDMKAAMPEGVGLGEIILAAPDLDTDSFANIITNIRGVARGFTLYAASNDRALTVSRNFWGSYRAGDIGTSGPNIIAGVDTIDVTAAGTDVFALNHADYAQNQVILRDVERLIRQGTRPPDTRWPALQKITTPTGVYWRYLPE